MPDKGTSQRAEATPGEAIRRVERSLGSVRSRARLLLVLYRGGLVLGLMLLLVIALGGVDFLLRMPQWMRLTIWSAGVLALGWAFVRKIWPAFRFNPTLTEIALRLEHSQTGRDAGVSGLLASALELSHDPREQAFASAISGEVESKFSKVRTASILSPGRALRAMLVLAFGLALGGALLEASPTAYLSRIGAERVLAPWTGAAWPRRTQVGDATDSKVHPLGTALPLRAVLVRSDRGPSETRVTAKYRIDADGQAGSVRSVVLTHQKRRMTGTVELAFDQYGREVEATGTEQILREGDLFERLIEPAAAAEWVQPAADANVKLELVYWFETIDDQTTPNRVLLVEPPTVLGATAFITSPGYAGSDRLSLDLGPGNDERSIVGPVLEGARIEVALDLNRPLPPPPATESARLAWISTMLGPDMSALAASGTDKFKLITEGRSWRVSWTLNTTTRISVQLVDAYRIRSAEDASYQFEVMHDRAPTATVTAPTEDKSVLPTATVEISGEARDDVGLEWAALEQQRAKRDAGSEGSVPEPIEPTSVIVRATPQADAEDSGRLLVLAQNLDLSALNLEPGDELWVSMLGKDAFDLDGKTHEPVRSTIRKLRIISEDQFIEQLWSELGAIRRNVIRLDEEQEDLQGDVERAFTAERSQRRQAGLTEQVARQRRALEQLGERTTENNLEDAAIDTIMRQAGEVLDSAGRASVRASEALEEIAQTERDGQQASQEQQQQASGAQREVRNQLSDLVDLLDQGEDTWAVRRGLERVLEDQQELQERTGEVAKRTAGQQLSDMSPEDRRDLQEIADQQQDLAQRAEEMIRQMLEREAQMRESDPASAQAMNQAAQRGQQDQVPERMQEAAQQAQQNQTNNAQQQQQEAIESLEEMLDDLENAERNRDEVLRRRLASIIESLQGLIGQQEFELRRLTDARALAAGLGGLDTGMVRMRQNTLGVLDEALESSRDLASVVQFVEQAAESQSGAIFALREVPSNADESEAQERLSLQNLRKALEEAERLDQEAAEREAMRKRDELKKAYIEALARQIAIRDETDLIAREQPTRRTRATARRLGAEQQELRERLSDIRKATEEINEAAVFDFAHKRIDGAMGTAEAGLGNGDANTTVVRAQDRAARMLRSLVDALDSEQNQDEDFRENEGSGGGGGAGSGEEQVVPPAAEVKLLRSMQEEAMFVTRESAELGDAELADDAASLQRGIAEQGADLLRRIQQQQQGGEPQMRPGQGGEPGEGVIND